MNARIVVEVVAVLSVVGLLLELAGGHTWVLVAAGVAAAIWLCSRAG